MYVYLPFDTIDRGRVLNKHINMYNSVGIYRIKQNHSSIFLKRYLLMSHVVSSVLLRLGK